MDDKKITPCLWYNNEAEDAAKFYVSIFKKDSRIISTSRYGKEGYEVHGQKAGTVMTVEFILNGQPFWHSTQVRCLSLMNQFHL